MDTIVSSTARALLQVVAGTLIARGYLTAGDADLLIGALVTIITLVWSILAKRRADQITAAKVEAAKADIPAQVAPVLAQATAATETAHELARTAKGLADTLRLAAQVDGLGERGA